MGSLYYGTSKPFAFDDRTLTHLRTIILGKLNLQESLVFTWSNDDAQNSLWMHPTIPLHFEFDMAVTPELNPLWLEQLLTLANSPGGLRLIPEPVAQPHQ